MTTIHNQLSADLNAALKRLLDKSPNVIQAPYRINNKTVCEEAGRHRTAIKKTAAFLEIRAAIELAAEKQRRGNTKERRLLARLRKYRTSNARLQTQVKNADVTLESAAEIIYRLYRQLQKSEEEVRYIKSKMRSLRDKDSAFDRAITQSKLDQLIDWDSE